MTRKLDLPETAIEIAPGVYVMREIKSAFAAPDPAPSPPPVTQGDPLLNAWEVEERWHHLKRRTMLRQAQRGEVEHVRIGKLVLFRRSAIEAYLAKHTIPVTTGGKR